MDNNVTDLSTMSMTEVYHQNRSADKTSFHDLQQVLDRYVTTVICVLGCIGNIINLVVLSSMRRRRGDGGRDSGASAGLIALALSDMAFCLVLLPRGFLRSQKAVFTGPSFWLYYQAYGTWFVTTFILTSTWITVTIATVRYLAICHPLNSKRYLGSVWFSRVAYVVAAAFGVILNIPSLWQFNIERLTDDLYLIDIGLLDLSSYTGHVYQWIRAIGGMFVPAVMLVFCNVSLIAALRRSRRMRTDCNAQNINTQVGNRITAILIVIVTSFIVLVFPSDLMDFIYGLSLDSNKNTNTIWLLRSVTNMLQVVNFSFNFVLYCCLNAQFRKILRECFCWYQYRKHESSEEFEKQWLRISRLSTKRSSDRRPEQLSSNEHNNIDPGNSNKTNMYYN